MSAMAHNHQNNQLGTHQATAAHNAIHTPSKSCGLGLETVLLLHKEQLQEVVTDASQCDRNSRTCQIRKPRDAGAASRPAAALTAKSTFLKLWPTGASLQPERYKSTQPPLDRS
eukprot:6443887-Amphidinium_carterae.1